MSYILDALKKAEAERTVDKIPNIHSQPLVATSSADMAALWQRPWIWFALMLMALVLMSVVAIQFNPWRATPNASANASANATLPAQPAPPSSITSMPPVAVTSAPPVDMDTQPKATPQKPAQPRTRTEFDQKSKASMPVQAYQKPVQSVTPAQREQAVVALRELPDHIQREIPQLSIGGFIYSSNRADRSVLINNMLLRDGDRVTADLTLEKMTPTGMIFNYKGYRYRTSY